MLEQVKKKKSFPFFSQKMRGMGINFVQCLLGKILVRSCGLISLPFLTFYLTREEMGIYQLLAGGLGIFVESAAVGTRQYFLVEYFKYESLYSRSILIIKKLWVVLKISSILFLISCLLLLVSFDFAYLCVFLLMFSQSYLNIFNKLFFVSLQFQMKFFRYNLTAFLFAASQMGLVFFLVAVMHLKLKGLALALFFSEVLLLTYFLSKNKSYISLLLRMRRVKNIHLRQVSQLLKKSWIFVPSTFSFWILVNIDQWMLGSMAGLEAVGLYAFAGKFPLLFDYLLSSTVIFVYAPDLYKGLKDRLYDFGAQNACVALCVAAMSCAAYFACAWILPFCRPLISQNFHEAIDYIPTLIFAACMRLATHLLQMVVRYLGYAGFVLWSNVLTAVVNIALNAFWIPLYGIHGCLTATALSFVFMFAINLAFHHYLIKNSRQKAEGTCAVS